MSQVSPLAAAVGYRAQYDLAFQISPIILHNGIASNVQGHLLPISSLLPRGPLASPTAAGAVNLANANPGQTVSVGSNTEPFARFFPLPGSTLISQAVGMYPFANQAIAANATIQQPLTISLAMVAPVNQPGGYLSKLQAFSALQAALAKHNAAGGTYIVATPAFVYMDVLLTAMTDISAEIEEEGSKQLQIQYQLDFIQPIVTQQQAQGQLNNLMQIVHNGNQVANPTWSGQGGASPANLTGVTGALGNVENALESFGGTL